MAAKGGISLLGLPDVEQVNLILINVLLKIFHWHICPTLIIKMIM
jgi:hypothetical protein